MAAHSPANAPDFVIDDRVPRRRAMFGLFDRDPARTILRRLNAKTAAEIASRRPRLAAAIRRLLWRPRKKQN